MWRGRCQGDSLFLLSCRFLSFGQNCAVRTIGSSGELCGDRNNIISLKWGLVPQEEA